jgi:hypothetical protein
LLTQTKNPATAIIAAPVITAPPLIYNLSPSSFGFLYQECPRCYWEQVVAETRRPSSPFPSIFSRIDSSMKHCFAASEWHSFGPRQPRFKIEYDERMIRSTPIFLPGHKVGVVIKGKYDSIVLFENGERAVCDFKTAPVRPEYLDKYGTQLHAYAHALENPALNSLSPGKVHRLGLAVFEPQSFAYDGQAFAQLKGDMRWLDVQRNDAGFMAFLEELVTLLENPMPGPSPTCAYCKYRKAS